MGDNSVEENNQDTADSELEQLRRAISHSTGTEVPDGDSTVSDITIIANANSYIEQLETHIEELRQENQQLKEGTTDSSSATESAATGDEKKLDQ